MLFVAFGKLMTEIIQQTNSSVSVIMQHVSLLYMGSYYWLSLVIITKKCNVREGIHENNTFVSMGWKIIKTE